MTTVLGGPAADGLVLRPFRAEDAPALVEIYRDATLRHFTRFPVTGLDGAARWLDAQERGWAEGTRYSFAVLAGGGGAEDPGGPGGSGGPGGPAGTLLANVVLKRGERGSPVSEVGYWTAAAARGRGVAPRALEALTGWAFEVFAADGLVRLDLLHQVDNPASCRVAEKTGYRYRALLPAFPPFPLDGHLHSRRAPGSASDPTAPVAGPGSGPD
ncbi:GNAT family N-acetyltransferase [Streptomyces sp. BE303]|uniref:GNAT family N-acetyltransferase n=1 Tax=Streptomyces sp. BE303 TaxID=3002528 RepID=UPI002E760F3A|nr:GNAT family N-acetyltransferase [Streptomyces sp. BE303]MED7948590.1 GNAT family N-acetyltransferase [Streptomyces sp. BE303]